MPIEPTDRAEPMQGLAAYLRAEASKLQHQPFSQRAFDTLTQWASEVEGAQRWFREAAARQVEASRQRPAAPKFGCHCDLANTVSGQPDECVFDNGDIEDCIYATELQRQKKGKTDCKYWQPIKFATPERPAAQAASAEPWAWGTPGGDVSRSLKWCQERCWPGGEQPFPLYRATPPGERPAAPAQAAVTDEQRVTIQAAIDALMETDRDCDYPLIDKLNELLAQASPAQPSGVDAQWVEQRLVMQGGPFKGKPQGWFTRPEVIAIIDEALSTALTGAAAQPAQEPDYPLWSEPIHAAQDSIASPSPQESAAAARKDADGVGGNDGR
jgi:hypothetical protein